MNKQKSKESNTTKTRYPWVKALMILVLYGALLFFLWNFPTEGGRAFFQTLLKGFVYIIAGGVLVIVSLIFFLLFPVPGSNVAEDEFGFDEDMEMQPLGGVAPARVLVVPAFRDIDVELKIWDLLYELDADLTPTCTIAADPESGIIAVTEENEEEADYVIQMLRKRLKAARIVVRESS